METGNELMKELATLMRVNPLPLFYTGGDETRAMRVKVGNSTSTCFHIRVSRECEIKSPSPHLANIDRPKRSGKDYRALSQRRGLSTPMCVINSRGDFRGDIFFRGARFIQREQ